MNHNIAKLTDEDCAIINRAKNSDTMAAMLVFSCLEHHKINQAEWNAHYARRQQYELDHVY